MYVVLHIRVYEIFNLVQKIPFSIDRRNVTYAFYSAFTVRQKTKKSTFTLALKSLIGMCSWVCILIGIEVFSKQTNERSIMPGYTACEHANGKFHFSTELACFIEEESFFIIFDRECYRSNFLFPSSHVLEVRSVM